MRNMRITGPTQTSPAWLNTVRDARSLLPAGGKVRAADVALAGGFGAVTVTASAAAAQGATALAVDALTGPIPAGTTLDFGGAKFARLTAAAAVGAIALAVSALPTAIADNDVAEYSGPGGRAAYLPSGTLVGRLIANRESGTLADRDFRIVTAANAAALTATDGTAECYLTAFDVQDATAVNDVELLVNTKTTVVKENYLPGAPLPAAVLAAIRARYTATVGHE